MTTTTPAPVRVLNAVGRRAGDFGPLGRLDAEELVRDARRRTGLSDLGPDTDHAFTLLVDSLDREARLTTLGRLVVWRVVHTYLAQRLRVVEALRRRPDLAATAGALGTATESGLGLGRRHRVLPAPKPIPGGIEFGQFIHVFIPGPEGVVLPFTGTPLMGFDVEPSTITDFRGDVALAYLLGTAETSTVHRTSRPMSASCRGTTWRRTGRNASAPSPSSDWTCSCPVGASRTTVTPRSSSTTFKAASRHRVCSGRCRSRTATSRSAATAGGRGWT